MNDIDNKPDILVLGAGASGITTALTLQLLGYKTRVIGAQFYPSSEKNGAGNSLFASRYPAASIIPHSVKTDRMDVLYRDSQQIFRRLYRAGMDMLRKNTHYEWFGYPVSRPDYHQWVEDFSPIGEDKNELSHKVVGAGPDSRVNGWRFSCFFVDWPQYINQLYEWYEQSGGQFEQKRVTPHNIKSFDPHCIVNCTGAHSRELFEDKKDFCFLLGKTLVVEDALSPGQFESIISYNYTPGAEVYSHSSGTPVDVYCYPRESGWVLGGSRLHGHLDEKGRWSGEQWTGRMLSIDQQQVPAPIFELNRNLISQIYDFDIGDYKLRSKSGYRFMRDSQTNGLRLEKSREYGKHIFHNYGHGGGGVTLSWGCALQVARMVRNYKTPSPPHEGPNKELNHLRQALNELF